MKSSATYTSARIAQISQSFSIWPMYNLSVKFEKSQKSLSFKFLLFNINKIHGT